MRMTPTTRRMATATIGGVLALALVACSSDDDSSDETAADEGTSDTTEEPADDAAGEDAADDDSSDDGAAEEESAEEGATDDGSAEEDTADDADSPDGGGGAAADWAAPVTTPGDQITTIEGETFTVDVYQVGTDKAPADGMLVDPENNKPIMAKGDDVVFVNYVITNTSSEPVNLGSSLVSIDRTYADWEYLQGMDSVTDDALYEKLEINPDGAAEYLDSGVYPLGPGSSISYGDGFMYKKDTALTFEAELTPVDESGELLSDKTDEASAEATLS